MPVCSQNRACFMLSVYWTDQNNVQFSSILSCQCSKLIISLSIYFSRNQSMIAVIWFFQKAEVIICAHEQCSHMPDYVQGYDLRPIIFVPIIKTKTGTDLNEHVGKIRDDASAEERERIFWISRSTWHCVDKHLLQEEMNTLSPSLAQVQGHKKTSEHCVAVR